MIFWNIATWYFILVNESTSPPGLPVHCCHVSQYGLQVGKCGHHHGTGDDHDYCSLTHRSRNDHVITNSKCQGKFGKQQEKMRGNWLISQPPLMVPDGTWAKQNANSKGSEPNRREAQEKRREIKDNLETLGGTKLAVRVLWLIDTSGTCHILSWERMPYMTLSSRIEFNSYSQMRSRWIE